MADDDPMKGRVMFWRRDRSPMHHGHVLNPFHPHRIVDMTKLVDVGVRCGDPLLEHRPLGHRTFSVRMKA
jgi:hypothetical protein